MCSCSLACRCQVKPTSHTSSPPFEALTCALQARSFAAESGRAARPQPQGGGCGPSSQGVNCAWHPVAVCVFLLEMCDMYQSCAMLFLNLFRLSVLRDALPALERRDSNGVMASKYTQYHCGHIYQWRSMLVSKVCKQSANKT